MKNTSGGSAQRRPKRNVRERITNEERFRRAKLRAYEKLTRSKAEAIEAQWENLKTNHAADHEKANGTIINLLNLDLSHIEIRSLIGCGGSRIASMQKRIDAGKDYEPIPRAAPSHALNKKSIEYLFSHMLTWNESLEQGFPCPHRRMKHYFLEKTTWYDLWLKYKESLTLLSEDDKTDIRLMEYSTFTQYVHQKSPGLRLARSKQDVCDSCVRLDFIIANPSSTEAEVAKAILEKETHNSAAVEQRRAVSAFTKQYASTLGYPLPPELIVLPDHLDERDDFGLNELKIEGNKFLRIVSSSNLI